jgi:hypothetical protein
MVVDTLALARDLRAAELPPAFAEAIAAAIGKGALDSADSNATKADLGLLRAEVAQDIAQLRHDVAHDIRNLRSEVGQMKMRLEGKLEALHAKSLTWFIGSQVAVGALIVALVKL